MNVEKISTKTKEYKIGYIDGYNKALRDMKRPIKTIEQPKEKYKKPKEKPIRIVRCENCRWWSKSKLKCYRPYANRQANATSFCDKGELKNEQSI